MDDIRARAKAVARKAREAARALRRDASDEIRALVQDAREARRGRARPETRRRDAEATKEAILKAARSRFSGAGYDQVGLREIAAEAGVDVALISRYFGSKEELFVAALVKDGDEPPRLSFPDDRSQWGNWLARQIVDHPQKHLSRLTLLQHSVTNLRIAALVRGVLTERSIKAMKSKLGDGEAGELRAALILSQISGLTLMRGWLGVKPLVNADREQLITLLGKAIQVYVDDAGIPSADRQITGPSGCAE